MTTSEIRSGFAAALGVAVCLTATLLPEPAHAQQFQLHAEGAVALWLDEPQSDRFAPGAYLALRPGLALGRMLSLQWSYAALMVPSGEGFDEAGAAHFLTTGLRLRPFASMQDEETQLGGLFVDVNGGYVRTGPLDRAGFDAGLGFGFQPADWFSVGPVVRYVQVLQPDRLEAQSPGDAQFLTVGLDFGFGADPMDEPVASAPVSAEPLRCPDAVICPEQGIVSYCPEGDKDTDRDGTCDSVDMCRTEIGPPATLGCPIDPCSGKPLVVLVQFPYDSSAMPAEKQQDPQTMDPVLDAIAKAISLDPSCRVCIVGHASEEGADDYNMDLSRRRATAVEQYLRRAGLPQNRLPTTGMGVRCPIEPETSRLLNRRVEFVRLMEGESCPTTCVE